MCAPVALRIFGGSLSCEPVAGENQPKRETAVDNGGEIIRVLREIRDEIRGTNARIDITNTLLDGINQRIDRLDARLAGVGR